MQRFGDRFCPGEEDENGIVFETSHVPLTNLDIVFNWVALGVLPPNNLHDYCKCDTHFMM